MRTGKVRTANIVILREIGAVLEFQVHSDSESVRRQGIVARKRLDRLVVCRGMSLDFRLLRGHSACDELPVCLCIDRFVSE